MVTELLGDGIVGAAFLGAKFIALYIAIMWVALVFWTFRDIRQRTNDLWLQLAATMLSVAFFLPGYWLYLVLRPRETLKERAEDRYREAIFAEYSSAAQCPGCRRKTRDDFVVCPYCEYTLRRSCEACSHALQASWSACPFCGKRSAAENTQEVFGVGSKPQRGSQPVHA